MFVIMVLAKTKTVISRISHTATLEDVGFTVSANKLLYFLLKFTARTTKGIVLARLCVKNSYISRESAILNLVFLIPIHSLMVAPWPSTYLIGPYPLLYI